MARAKNGLGYYGNDANYLCARIARDRPDILERMKAGEYTSVRKAAIDAGIPHVVRDSSSNPDRGAERIARAWVNADLEDKIAFLTFFGVEIEAVSNLVWEYHSEEDLERLKEQAERELLPPRRGHRPYRADAETPIPEVEAAIKTGLAVSEIARRLGVSYNTVNRWRHGQTRPSAKMLAQIKATLAGLDLPQSLY